ncbi:hypothetical protein RFI_13648, partial [Reticulomyxa filosa]
MLEKGYKIVSKVKKKNVTSESYVVGAQVLIHSLHRNGGLKGRKDLALRVISNVLVTKSIGKESRKLLKESGWDYVTEVSEIPNPLEKGSKEASSLHWYNSGYTKLRIFEMVQLTTAVAGTKTEKSITNDVTTKKQLRIKKLFYIDADCIVVRDISDIFKLPDDVTFAAAPDLCPPDHFNAGVLFIQPNVQTFQQLLRNVAYVNSCF